jgi:hypothetical protein
VIVAAIALHVIGVGNNPHPLSSVRRTGMDSTHHDRPAGVAKRFQVSEHLVSRCSAQARDVLNDNPRGSCLLDDSCELRPEVPCIVASPATAGDRVRLAGEAAGNEVNAKSSGVEPVDVVMDWHSRKVLGQNLSAVRLDLAERDRLPAHPPRGQGEAADAAEQVEVPHRIGLTLVTLLRATYASVIVALAWPASACA